MYLRIGTSVYVCICVSRYIICVCAIVYMYICIWLHLSIWHYVHLCMFYISTYDKQNIRWQQIGSLFDHMLYTISSSKQLPVLQHEQDAPNEAVDIVLNVGLLVGSVGYIRICCANAKAPDVV